MNTLKRSRYAFCLGATAALLTAGGAPPQGPAVAPLAARGAKPATSSQYNVLFRFRGGTDGAHPHSGLIDVDGTLYGTTLYGGVTTAYCRKGCGTVYAVSTSGAGKVLYAFLGSRYGSKNDGDQPVGDLLVVNDTLYGTTFLGGPADQGTFYGVSLAGKEKVVRGFNENAGGGAYPAAGLIDANGLLYGTTEQGCDKPGQCGMGNTYGNGVVYSVNATTGQEKVLHAFGPYNGGAWPYAPVTDVNGTLYGTTRFSSQFSGGDGVVYSVSRTSGGEHLLHNFIGGSDGRIQAARAKPRACSHAMVTAKYGTRRRGNVG